MKKSKGAIGATVQYCGHRATFIADIITVGDACVVRGNLSRSKPGTFAGFAKLLDRSVESYEAATHHMSDCPGPVFWCPERSLFVVPSDNITVLKGAHDS